MREYGLICDRGNIGLGRVLLTTGRERTRINVEHPCGVKEPHTHEVVTREVTYGEWEPVEGIGNFVSRDDLTTCESCGTDYDPTDSDEAGMCVVGPQCRDCWLRCDRRACAGGECGHEVWVA